MKTKTKKRKPLTLRKHNTRTLAGLPGVAAEETQAVDVTSPSDASQFMRKGMAVTAAGDSGAVVVWKGDDGKWRCEFMRFLRTIDQRKFTAMAAAWQWLKEWWPQMRKD